jgi:hypothetical protein
MREPPTALSLALCLIVVIVTGVAISLWLDASLDPGVFRP